jgi:hypothetical protein
MDIGINLVLSEIGNEKKDVLRGDENCGTGN